MLDHTDCAHEATKKDRAACRKAHAELADITTRQIDDLLEVFAERASGLASPTHWVFYAARRFADYRGEDPRQAAWAVLEYFTPSGDDEADARRIRNGYTITTNIHTMLRITLRAAS
jgi:hypothetical protein